MMISKEQFLAIKRCQSEGMSMAAAAKQIGISVQTHESGQSWTKPASMRSTVKRCAGWIPKATALPMRARGRFRVSCSARRANILSKFTPLTRASKAPREDTRCFLLCIRKVFFFNTKTASPLWWGGVFVVLSVDRLILKSSVCAGDDVFTGVGVPSGALGDRIPLRLCAAVVYDLKELAPSERLLADARHAGGDRNAREAIASIERFFIDARYAVWDDNARKVGAKEHPLANALDSGGERYARKVRAIKRMIPDMDYAVGDHDARKAVAALKRILTDARYAIGDRHARKERAILERFLTDACDGATLVRRGDLNLRCIVEAVGYLGVRAVSRYGAGQVRWRGTAACASGEAGKAKQTRQK